MNHKAIGDAIFLLIIAINAIDDLIRLLKHDNSNPLINRKSRIIKLIINVIAMIVLAWDFYF